MILKLITDHLLLTDKIVLSCRETTPFSNLLGPMLKRVAIETIRGHAIYICKGNPPRPSIPLFPADMKKSPKKLGLVHQKTVIAIMKETGGVKERKVALATAQKEEKQKQEDPEAYKAMERERERIQREKNLIVKAMRDVDSDDDLPPELACKLMAPSVVAACYTIICSEIGCWLEPRYLAKIVPIAAAALCAAIPTYFGERELDRRCGEARDLLTSPQDIKTSFISDSSSRWICNDPPLPDIESNLNHFVAKLIQIHQDKQGDLFDELLQVLTFPPDLPDRELVLSRAMYNLYLHDEDVRKQNSEEDQETDSDGDMARVFIAKLVGLGSESLDIVSLCGKGPSPLSTNFTAKLSEALAIAASGYLPAEPQSPASPKSSSPDSPKGSPIKGETPGFDLAQSSPTSKERALAEAWEYITRHIKCLFQFSSLEAQHGTDSITLWKGMSHVSLKLLDQMVKYKRGTVLGWPVLSKFGTTQKTEEGILLEGYKASTANLFGGKNQVDDYKGTILFKVTKVPVVITAANNELMLSPFTQLEVSSVRPNTNVSDNSFDFDMKYTKSLFTQELVDSTKQESLAVSRRAFSIIQKPIVLATTVLGIATCVACIGPILEEKERIHQELLQCASVCVTVASAAASQAASDHIELVSLLNEEERQQKLKADEAKRQEEQQRLLAEQQQREKEESDRLASEAAAVAASPTSQSQPPLLVYSPSAENTEIDWEREELEAMKRFEELFAERKKELDEYERSRIERTTKWEETMLVAIEKTATERQISLDEKIKEQEERLRQLNTKATEAEELVKRIDNETERKRALQMAEDDRAHLQRQQLRDERHDVTQNMTAVMEKIHNDNVRIQEQLRQSAEQLSTRHGEYGNLLRTISEAEKQRMESLQQTKSQTTITDKGAAFRLTEAFAPVLGWLLSIGMTRFADILAENELTLSSVKELTEADLEEMGVAPLGPRTILLNAIRTLKEKGYTAAPSAGGLQPLPAFAQSEESIFNTKKILTDFYLKYDPGKVCQVNEIYIKFEGQPERLFATLSSIYPIYFPSPYKDRTVTLLKTIAPGLVPAVDILLDLHQDREIELLGDLLRVSDGLPLALSPSNTRASHIGRRAEYDAKHQISLHLQSQNNPNPEAVAGLLTSTFSNNTDVLLQAFKEVELGEKPSLM